MEAMPAINDAHDQREPDRFIRLLVTWSRRIRSDLHTLKFVSGSYANVVIAVAIAIGTILGSSLHEPFNTALVIIGLSGAILAAILKGGLVWKLASSGVLRRSSNLDYLQGKLPNHDLMAAWGSTQQASWLSRTSTIEWQTYFWEDLEVNKILSRYIVNSHEAAYPESNLPRLRATIRANQYKLPAALDIIAPHILWISGFSKEANSRLKRFLGRPARFNGHLMRLATEPTVSQLEQGDIQIQHARYFDGECSNEAWKYELQKRGINQELIKDYVFNDNGNIKALHESELANIIGVTILAVTSDGYAVFVRQAKINAVAPDHFATTGSGSITRDNLHDFLAQQSDYRQIPFYRLRRKFRLLSVDQLYREPISFIDLMFASMYQRMVEESGIDRDPVRAKERLTLDNVVDSASFRCTGYFRWMARAAKPEFSGLVRLRISKASIEAGFRMSTLVDSSALEFVDIISHKSIDEVISQLGRDSDGRSSMNPSSEYTLKNALEYISHNPAWTSPKVE